MKMRTSILAATLGTVLASHASAQTPSEIGNRSAIRLPSPDFSGVWRHPSLPGYEPPVTGPGPVTNRARKNGVSNYDRLEGDHTNPILQPWAAEIVKRFGALSAAGVTYANPANQCWPEPVPFIYKNFGMQMFQQPDKITVIYSEDHEIRWIRMNVPHPAEVTPSWHGDSVGHYEGETLVVDTVGVRTDRPFAMIDLYGTPYTRALHIVERFRLLDYEEAKEGLDQDAKENFRVQPESIDRTYRGKHLQVRFTVEDDGVFTTPWTATITFGPAVGEWPEISCPENRHEYSYEIEADVPFANEPDF